MFEFFVLVFRVIDGNQTILSRICLPNTNLYRMHNEFDTRRKEKTYRYSGTRKCTGGSWRSLLVMRTNFLNPEAFSKRYGRSSLFITGNENDFLESGIGSLNGTVGVAT